MRGRQLAWLALFGPITLVLPLADTMAATFALVGLLGAVYERDVAGSRRGQEVDVGLYEPLFRLAESQMIGYDQLSIIKRRRGNRIEEDSPRSAYATKDGGWIAISASSDRTFGRLVEAIGRPELAEEERFADNEARIEKRLRSSILGGQRSGSRRLEKQRQRNRATSAGWHRHCRVYSLR